MSRRVWLICAQCQNKPLERRGCTRCEGNGGDDASVAEEGDCYECEGTGTVTARLVGDRLSPCGSCQGSGKEVVTFFVKYTVRDSRASKRTESAFFFLDEEGLELYPGRREEFLQLIASHEAKRGAAPSLKEKAEMLLRVHGGNLAGGYLEEGLRAWSDQEVGEDGGMVTAEWARERLLVKGADQAYEFHL